MSSSGAAKLHRGSGGEVPKQNLVLLLTDIVGSTKLGIDMGDDAWIEILIRHFERARKLKDQFKGDEIKLIGDAYMAVFDSSAQALDFAKGFFIDTGDPQVLIRVAIHFGAVFRHEKDIYGLSVNRTARIIHTMEAPGIVLSDQAKQQVVDARGKEVLADFQKKRVELKDFGFETVWRYVNQQMLHQFRLNRREAYRAAQNVAKSGQAKTVTSQPLTRPQLIPPQPANDASESRDEMRRLLENVLRPPSKKS